MLPNRVSATRLTRRLSPGLLIASAVVLFVLLGYLTLYAPETGETKERKSGTHPPSQYAVVAGEQKMNEGERLVRAAASNRTLGFSSIQFLNLPHRHDRADAAFLQAYLTDLEITRFPAVRVEDLRERGLPPTSQPSRLKMQEKACYRAHANVWQHMVERRIPALMVLESDAAWDIGLKEMMATLNGPFRDLTAEATGHSAAAPDPSDPWMAGSGAWDVLLLGGCSETWREGDPYRIYADPRAPAARGPSDKLPASARGRRAVFRALGVSCPTAYAVTLRGAAKMLLRTAWNLDEPVDLVMSLMSIYGELVVYSVRQRIFAQWAYVPGIGMGARGANSDINDQPDGDGDGTDGWERAKQTHNVWGYKPKLYNDTGFEQMAMQAAWDRIIGQKGSSGRDEGSSSSLP
ncbi:hypothetical protein RB595_004296 [Gaeumannomyces hyphopodioides]